MSATANDGRGLKELVLGVLKRDDGVELERLACVPGSVPRSW